MDIIIDSLEAEIQQWAEDFEEERAV